MGTLISWLLFGFMNGVGASQPSPAIFDVEAEVAPLSPRQVSEVVRAAALRVSPVHAVRRLPSRSAVSAKRPEDAAELRRVPR